MWLSEVVVTDRSVQFVSKPAVPTLRLYCHLLVASPVTEEVTVSLPLPAPTATGLSGLPGLVKNVAVARRVEHALSL